MNDGELIGPYRILGRLAAGGMGETYVAERVDVGKRVCLKRILPHHATKQAYVDSFLQEARIAARVSHQNLVTLLDCGVDAKGGLFIVYELIEGTDLSKLCESQPHGCLRPDMVALIAHDIANGLDCLHTDERRHEDDDRRGPIVHRDLSCNNVVISYRGAVIVIDFGIGKMLTKDDTQSTMVKGKVRYMAPETVRAQRFDTRVDQWALGVVLYRALSGSYPFDGDDQLAVLSRLVQADYPPLASPLGSLDPRWTAIVGRLLQADPDERYPTLAELVDDLEPLMPPARVRRELGGIVRVTNPPKSLNALPAMSASVDAGARTATTTPDAPARADAAAPTTPGPISGRTSPLGAPAPASVPSAPALATPPRSSRVGMLVAATFALVALAGGAAFAGFAFGGASTDEAATPPTNAGTASGPAGLVVRADAATPGPPEAEVRPRSEGSTADAGMRDTPAAPTVATEDPRTPQPASETETVDSPGAAEDPAPARTGQLRVTVFPWGEVWIDGRRHGRAPVSVRVPEGTHSVGVGRGSIEERRRVRVEAGQTGAVHVDLE